MLRIVHISYSKLKTIMLNMVYFILCTYLVTLATNFLIKFLIYFEKSIFMNEYTYDLGRYNEKFNTVKCVSATLSKSFSLMSFT